MKVLYIPQRNDEKIEYEFTETTITAYYKGKSDTFDFTGLSDGVLNEVSSALEVNPLVHAEIKDGELFVKLLYFHGKDATHEEKFPEWKGHTELEVGLYGGD